MLYVFSFIVIILLILTNAITDAPNAIATLVGSKTVKFKKAAYLSAIFNMAGIIVMSNINISVANCISTMVRLEDGIHGIIALTSAIISVIIFALIAMKYGIPTSETHGLVAGITGSSLALYGIYSINWFEWKNVIIGLIWSIVGTYFISIIISKLLNKTINRMNVKNIKRTQIFGCCAMSFMHGAQDGQKFIGVIIIFLGVLKTIFPFIDIFTNTIIIIFVAIIMGIGVAIGGKSIVDNVGSNITKIDNKKALLSDISSAITLLFASLTGLPVSTTHVKTISIVSVGKLYKDTINKEVVLGIMKAWIWTFPICGIISYMMTKGVELLI